MREVIDIPERDRSDKIGLLGTEWTTCLMILMSYNGHVGHIYKGSRLTTKLQKMGVDAIIWTSPYKALTIEIKASANISMANAFIEEGVNDRPGWIYNLESDYLIFIYLQDMTVYVMDICLLQEWYAKNKSNYNLRDRGAKGRPSFTKYRLVPWKDLIAGMGEENIAGFNLKDEKSIMVGLKRLGLWNYAEGHGLPEDEYRFSVIYGNKKPTTPVWAKEELE